MQQNCAHVIQLIGVAEGGFVNNPTDPGGATNHGVTIKTLAAWRAPAQVTIEDVKALGEEEAAMIFRAQYLRPIQFDKLPDGLDYCVADCSVNSGPALASRLLQTVLGVEVDGVIGLHTLAAMAGKDTVDLIHAYSQARLGFMRSLATWPTFGRGWASRVARVEHEAAEMATGIDHAAKPDLAPGASAKAPPSPPADPSRFAALVTAILALFRRS